MRGDEREEALRELDGDMKYFRLAAGRKIQGWRDKSLLRGIRQGLGIPVREIVEGVGVSRAVLWRLENREARRTITLEALDRVAKVMGCRVVYGIVPESGGTMAETGARIRWLRKMVREHGLGVEG